MKKTKMCKYCREEIDSKAKVCPHCKKKQGSPKWLIIIIVILIIAAVGSALGGNESSNNKYEQNKENKITVIDFSSMTKADIDTWCESNKVNCNIKDEYSDSIMKDNFVSQSIDANQTIYEGDKITIVFSLGKEPTAEQKNALKKAESYSKTSIFSFLFLEQKSAAYKPYRPAPMIILEYCIKLFHFLC